MGHTKHKGHSLDIAKRKRKNIKFNILHKGMTRKEWSKFKKQNV